MMKSRLYSILIAMMLASSSVQSQIIINGDINNDGEITVTDVEELVKTITIGDEPSYIFVPSSSTNLPEYWQSYLSERETIINEDTKAPNTDSFIFITDTHQTENNGKSTGIIEHIIKNTYVCKTVFGGDACSTGSPNGGSYENLFAAEMKAQEQLANAARKYGKFYAMRGNHDFYEYDGGTKYSIGYEKAVAYLKKMSDEVDAVMADDTEAHYFYVDSPESGIRHIFLDCVAGSTTGYQRLSLAQLQWLISTIQSSTKDVVIMGHFPVTPWFATSDENSKDYFKCVRDVILAANQRGSGSVTYTSCGYKASKVVDPDKNSIAQYDFSKWNKKVLLYLNGHNHTDNQTYHEGVPFVTVMTDKGNQKIRPPFWEDTSLILTNKPKRTTNEQAMDVISIPNSHDKIIFRRVGFGFDRTFHIGEIKLSVGQTTSLSSSFDNMNITWNSSNCAIGQVSGKTMASCVWPYMSTIVSIEEGVVTALSPGEAFVYAEDSNHNKEFWAIKVTE